MKLYEITNEIQNILDRISDDGELPQELIDNIDTLQNDFNEKAIAVASYIKNIEAEEKAINDAIKEMADRRNKLLKKIESLSDYLQCNLQQMSVNEINSSPYFKIKLKTCPASVDIFDEELIPSEFIRQKISVMVDKIKLKEALVEGNEIPGAALQRRIKLEIK